MTAVEVQRTSDEVSLEKWLACVLPLVRLYELLGSPRFSFCEMFGLFFRTLCTVVLSRPRSFAFFWGVLEMLDTITLPRPLIKASFFNRSNNFIFRVTDCQEDSKGFWQFQNSTTRMPTMRISKTKCQRGATPPKGFPPFSSCHPHLHTTPPPPPPSPELLLASRPRLVSLGSAHWHHHLPRDADPLGRSARAGSAEPSRWRTTEDRRGAALRSGFIASCGSSRTPGAG